VSGRLKDRMWFLYGKCKIFFDIKCEDLTNPMGAQRKHGMLNRPPEE
jgi:hypothetical protein